MRNDTNRLRSGNAAGSQNVCVPGLNGAINSSLRLTASKFRRAVPLLERVCPVFGFLCAQGGEREMTEVQRSETRLQWARQQGAELGSDLARALFLAVRRSGDDRDAKAQFAQMVLREILAAVEKLRDSGASSVVVREYERACRQA